MSWSELSQETREQLRRARLQPDEVLAVLVMALDEDLPEGHDVTTEATVSPEAHIHAELRARATGCVAGLPIARGAFELVAGANEVTFTQVAHDGDRVAPGSLLATVEGPTRALLTAERTALNLLCHLSGVATATATWADAVAGTNATIRDTRKTTPGLRALEKYAVRCGGGSNHRMSLSDAALVKDNHVVAAGSMTNAVAAVLERAADVPVEIEVDSLDQLDEALAAGAQLVLLDNMDVTTTRRAVEIARRHSERTGRAVALESSGGLTLERARAVAETGVDFLSVGAITHSAPVLDVGLDFLGN
jgi:nicotinate-nucleotide pyrophosphorylase (carboxylating)